MVRVISAFISSKLTQVVFSYFKWMCGASSLIFLAIVSAHYCQWYALNASTIDNLGLLGFLFTGTAFGKRGREIQTWSGQSSAEKLNEGIYLALSSTGLYLMVFSFVLKR